MKAGRDYKQGLIKRLEDPKEAEAYLNAALEDGNPKVFFIALRDVAAAQGNMTAFAQKCNFHRASLYKMTSKTGNPSMESIMHLIQCIGLSLKVEIRSRVKLRHA